MDTKQLFARPFISLSGDVNATMLSQLDSELKSIDAMSSTDPLRVLVTSGGGSIWFGEAIAERLKLINRVRQVQVVAMTRIASAAVLFPLAVPRAQRFVSPQGLVTLHQFRFESSFPKQLAVGTESVVREAVHDQRDFMNSYRRHTTQLAREMNMKYDDLRRRMDHGWYVSAREAVRRGLFHSIIT